MRQEIARSGEWPGWRLAERDIHSIRLLTPTAPLPTEYVESEALENGRQFIESLADDPDNIYHFTMADNEGWRSLRGIVEALPEGELSSDLLITARELRPAGDRGEVDFPHHLSISTNDLLHLAEKVGRIRLFVHTNLQYARYDELLPRTQLVTIDLSSLGLAPVNANPNQQSPNKFLVIPYDYFVMATENSGTETFSQQPSGEAAPIPKDIELRADEPGIAEIVTACQHLLSPEDLASLTELTKWEDVMALASTLLIENGVADPELFWQENGLLD